MKLKVWVHGTSNNNHYNLNRFSACPFSSFFTKSFESHFIFNFTWWHCFQCPIWALWGFHTLFCKAKNSKQVVFKMRKKKLIPHEGKWEIKKALHIKGKKSKAKKRVKVQKFGIIINWFKVVINFPFVFSLIWCHIYLPNFKLKKFTSKYSLKKLVGLNVDDVK